MKESRRQVLLGFLRASAVDNDGVPRFVEVAEYAEEKPEVLRGVWDGRPDRPVVRKVGRPTKCTPDTQEVVCAAIAEGLSIANACQIAGISETAINDWQRRGGLGESPYVEFLTAMRHARVQGKLTRLRHINRAAETGAWQAAAWYLERVYPDEYGKRQRIEHEGSVSFGKQSDRLVADILGDRD
jgi:hypothetical protein